MSTFQVSSRPSVEVKISSSQGDLMATCEDVLKKSTSTASLTGSTGSGMGSKKNSAATLFPEEVRDEPRVTFGNVKTFTMSTGATSSAPLSSAFPSNSIFAGLSSMAQQTLRQNTQSLSEEESTEVHGLSTRQQQMYTICQHGLQLLKADFKRLNRSNVYAQQFTINTTLKEFSKTVICVDFMLALIDYLDRWVVAAADLEVLLCDYENRSSSPDYGCDEQCFHEYVLTCKYKKVISAVCHHRDVLAPSALAEPPAMRSDTNRQGTDGALSLSTDTRAGNGNGRVGAGELASGTNDDANTVPGTPSTQSPTDAAAASAGTAAQLQGGSPGVRVQSPTSAEDEDLMFAASEIERTAVAYHMQAQHSGSALSGANGSNSGKTKNSGVTHSRQRVLDRVKAVLHRVTREIHEPLQTLTSRHNTLRKRLLWLSEAARLLPKCIAALGSCYYRVLSWRVQLMSATTRTEGGGSTFIRAPKGSKSLRSLTDDTFYDHLVLLSEKVVECVYPALWQRVRHEVTRLFRSDRYSASIAKQREREGGISRVRHTQNAPGNGNSAANSGQEKSGGESANLASAPDAAPHKAGGSGSGAVPDSADSAHGNTDASGNLEQNPENSSGNVQVPGSGVNPYAVIPTNTVSHDYVSMSALGVHSVLLFLLADLHKGHNSQEASAATGPAVSVRSARVLGIAARLRSLQCGGEALDVDQDMSAGDAAQATDAGAENGNASGRTSATHASPSSSPTSAASPSLSSSSSSSSSSAILPFPLPPVVVPWKCRHIQLHHLYETEYGDVKYQHNTIFSPFHLPGDSRKPAKLTLPSVGRFNTSASQCGDQRSPMLDVVSPSSTSLQHYQTTVLNSRAKLRAAAQQQRAQRVQLAWQHRQRQGEVVAAQAMHGGEVDDGTGTGVGGDVLYEEDSGGVVLPSVWRERVNWSGSLRSGIRGRTGVFSGSTFRDNGKGGYTGNGSPKDKFRKNNPEDRSHPVSLGQLHRQGISADGRYVGIVNKHGRTSDDFSFASFASTATFNTVGIPKPSSKMRTRMAEARAVVGGDPYHARREAGEESSGTGTGIGMAAQGTAGKAGKKSALVIDSSTQLRTNYTQHITHALGFDDETVDAHGGHGSSRAHREKEYAVEGEAEIDYYATVMNKDRAIYTKNGTATDLDARNTLQARKAKQGAQSVIVPKTVYDDSVDVEQLIQQIAHKQQNT